MLTAPACPVCNAKHVVCGAAGAVTPVDIPKRRKAAVGDEVKPHNVRWNGIDVVMMLNDADAKRYGATPVDEQPSESDAETAAAPVRKARRVPNKARTGE